MTKIPFSTPTDRDTWIVIRWVLWFSIFFMQIFCEMNSLSFEYEFKFFEFSCSPCGLCWYANQNTDTKDNYPIIDQTVMVWKRTRKSFSVWIFPMYIGRWIKRRNLYCYVAVTLIPLKHDGRLSKPVTKGEILIASKIIMRRE